MSVKFLGAEKMVGLADLFSLGRVSRVKGNKVLFSEENICNSIVYISSGVARQFIPTDKGQSITKSFVTGGDVFLYSTASYLTQKPGEVCFETLTDCELIEWPVQVLENHLGKEKWVSIRNGIFTDLFLRSERREISLLTESATSRVREFTRDNGDLFSRIPHYYIASYLRLAPETLSRIRSSINDPKPK